MFDAIVSFFQRLFAAPLHDELLVRVRGDEKRGQLPRRR